PEEPVRLNDRLDHDGVEGAGGHGDRFAPEDVQHHRVTVLLEVAVDRVAVAGLERERPRVVEERHVVERAVGREAPDLTGHTLTEAPALRVEVEDPVPLEPDLVLVLLEATGEEAIHVQPAVHPRIDTRERDAALDVQPGVESSLALDILGSQEL